MAKVSIIVPAFNAENTVAETLDSILSQTFSDFEVIVINDCSNDRTIEVLTSYSERDNRIKVYSNAVNSGVSFSRNFGVKTASSEWIAFLDSDDKWREDKLEKQLGLLEEYPDASLIYTGSSFMDENGQEYGYTMHVENKLDYKTLLKRNLISCSSVLVKKSVMEKIEMPSDKMSEDYYAWLKIVKAEKYAYGIDEPLLIYRLSRGSKSSNRIKAAKMHYRAYRAVGYNPISAFFLTFRYVFYSVKKRKNIKNS